ncbi:MAG: efflux RND transporter periplasmic adaptor subunit [Synergistaceae bacterium]|nr:efflux RND transporter periplasmic adaptor subunit [Synergistaceae bacterium]
MTERKKRRGGSGFVVLLALGLVAGAFVLQQSQVDAQDGTEGAPPSMTASEEAPARVTVVAARKEERFAQGFQASSTLEPLEEVTLHSKVTGRLVELRVHQGDSVKAGDVVAILDHRDQDAQIAALKAQVAVAEAEVAQAKVTLDDAQRERDRYRKLLEEGFATQQELDSRETAYQSARAAFQRAQAAVVRQRADLKTQEVLRSEYILKAPIDGTVLDDYSLAPGTMISPSTAVLKIGRIGVLKAVLQIPETRAMRLREGMAARLSGDSFAGIEGRILRIRPYVDVSTRTIQVEVSVENGEGRLRPGMFANVYLVEEEVDEALVIPSEALRQGGVFVVEEGKVRLRAVEKGIEASGLVEIRRGLIEGELVVVTGATALQDGDRVAFNLVGGGGV